jgi:hypothetical protein
MSFDDDLMGACEDVVTVHAVSARTNLFYMP